MENFDKAEIANKVEELLKRKPFAVDKVAVGKLWDDVRGIVLDVPMTKAEGKLLREAPRYLKYAPRSVSLELSGAPKGQRRNIGLVSTEKGYVAVLLKTEKVNEKEKLMNYGMDSYYLHGVRLAIQDVVDNWTKGSSVGKESAQVKTGAEREATKIRMQPLKPHKDMALTFHDATSIINLATKPFKYALILLLIGYAVIMVEIVAAALIMLWR